MTKPSLVKKRVDIHDSSPSSVICFWACVHTFTFGAAVRILIVWQIIRLHMLLSVLIVRQLCN